ncbi:MAG: ABC transporter substrate-binding protein [Candidatus Cloacimonadaceae bacterium]|jgi:iron complex transport system substrate-binding protein
MYKKTFVPLLVALASFGAITGCSNKGEKQEQISVTDMVGTTITINKNPKKVACVSRTTYDLLVAYGLGDKIDGAYKGTLNNDWVPLIYPESKNHYVYEYNNSSELFLSRGVDLVFAPEKYIADDLNAHGVPALCISLYGNPTFDNYVTFLSQLVTKIWDGDDIKAKAAAWENKVTTAINDVAIEFAKYEKKKLFYVRGDKDKGVGYTDTKGSFTEYAYRLLGFDFIGSSLTTNQPSIEEIVAQNPDVFVCGGQYQNKNINALKTDETLKNLDAVKNNKIYNIPIGFTAFEQLSAMTPIFFYDQANKIYPEYFSYDIPSRVKTTIKEYFGTDLTDDQVSYMLNGLNPQGGSLY